MVSLLRAFLVLRLDRRAVTSIEYSMIAAIIIVTIVGSVLAVGNHLPSMLNKVSSEL